MNQPLKKAREKIKETGASHIYVLPNLLTTTNMFFGFMSIIFAIRGEYTFGSYAIVAAAVFDLLDGRVARLTDTTSQFGAEYDSLCDLVSFGMAPALIMYLWALQPFGRVGWLACFVFVACGALRLARFKFAFFLADILNFSNVVGSHIWKVFPCPTNNMLFLIFACFNNFCVSKILPSLSNCKFILSDSIDVEK